MSTMIGEADTGTTDDDFAVGVPEPEEAASPPAPERPGTSPDAPYGRKPDGTPYKRRPYAKRSGGKRTGRRATPVVNIQEGLTEMHVSVGMLALLRGDQELATLLIGEQRLREMIEAGQQTPSIGVADAAGTAWAKIAAQSPAWEQFFTRILQTGVWAEVMNAYLPLVLLTVRRKPVRIAVVKRLFARRKRPTNGQRPAPQRPVG